MIHILIQLFLCLSCLAAEESSQAVLSSSSENAVDVWATGKGFLITFLHPDFGTFSLENVTTIKERLICEAIFFTAHDDLDPLFTVEDSMRKAYAEFQVGVCLVTMRSPPVDDPSVVEKMKAAGDFHYARYRAAFVLVSAVLFNDVIRRADGSLPWLMYLDTDAFLANRRLTMDDLLARIGRGLQRPEKTTEFRFAEKHKALLPPEGSFPESIDQLALVWALEVFCESSWGANSGVVLLQPSRAVLFVMAMVLEAMFITKGDGLDEIADQGSLNYVLQFLGDLSAERRIAVCESPLYHQPAQGQSDEIVFTRALNFSKVQENPRFQAIADAIWNNTTRGPLHVAWTSPRWMNSPACPWYLTDDGRGQLAFHAGDFICHFNSCNHIGYTTPWFRSIISDHGSDYFPTFDENRDWQTWKNGFVPVYWVTPHKDARWH